MKTLSSSIVHLTRPMLLCFGLQLGLGTLVGAQQTAVQSISGLVPARVSLEPALNKTILDAKQGQIVELPGFLTEKMANIGYKKIVLPGPQFLISDNPEYIRVPEGIAMQEAVQPGTVRLYLYNVNGVKEPSKLDRKITPVIRNTGDAVLHLRMLKYSSQKPSGNYFQIGKQGLADFFASKPENSFRSIKPGEAISIDPKFETNILRYDELAHGFYEFVIDQPGEISIIQTDPATSGPKALARLKNNVLPSSHKNAGRGLFGISNYQVLTEGVFDTKNGAAQLVLADGEKDPWIIGKESGTNAVVTLDGNYGVLYTIDMTWKSTDGKGLALVTWNARGDGEWCGGMANTMVVSKGKFNEGIIQLPSDRLTTRKYPEAILIQVFKPAADGKEQKIHLTYSPPGASCLPTPLIFVPVDIKD